MLKNLVSNSKAGLGTDHLIYKHQFANPWSENSYIQLCLKSQVIIRTKLGEKNWFKSDLKFVKEQIDVGFLYFIFEVIILWKFYPANKTGCLITRTIPWLQWSTVLRGGKRLLLNAFTFMCIHIYEKISFLGHSTVYKSVSCWHFSLHC